MTDAKLNILVVDDEALARRRLLRLLQKMPGVGALFEAVDGFDAQDKLAAEAPDLVLLDIHMPQMDGLSFAAQDKLPPVIFTTAHDEHAVKAFELGALDYLLKPIAEERLLKALARVQERLNDGLAPNLGQALGSLSQAPRLLRLKARQGGRLRLFDPADVTRIRATDKYSVFLHQGEELMLDDSLNALQARLEDRNFLRVHRAELINLNAVSSIERTQGQLWVTLRDGQRAPVSRRLAAELKRRLAEL